MPTVNPEILAWARNAAGLSLDAAAQKLGIQPASGVSPTERLAALEEGSDPPSRPMLVKMAHHSRRVERAGHHCAAAAESSLRRGERSRTGRPHGSLALHSRQRPIFSGQARARVRDALEEQSRQVHIRFVGCRRDGAPDRCPADAFRRYLAEQTARFADIIKRGNIKLE